MCFSSKMEITLLLVLFFKLEVKSYSYWMLPQSKAFLEFLHITREVFIWTFQSHHLSFHRQSILMFIASQVLLFHLSTVLKEFAIWILRTNKHERFLFTYFWDSTFGNCSKSHEEQFLIHPIISKNKEKRRCTDKSCKQLHNTWDK